MQSIMTGHLNTTITLLIKTNIELDLENAWEHSIPIYN